VGVSIDCWNVFRVVYRFSYLSRGRYRTTRRGVGDSVRLGLIARELARYYLRVVCWSGFDRVLEVGF